MSATGRARAALRRLRSIFLRGPASAEDLVVCGIPRAPTTLQRGPSPVQGSVLAGDGDAWTAGAPPNNPPLAPSGQPVLIPAGGVAPIASRTPRKYLPYAFGSNGTAGNFMQTHAPAGTASQAATSLLTQAPVFNQASRVSRVTVTCNINHPDVSIIFDGVERHRLTRHVDTAVYGGEEHRYFVWDLRDEGYQISAAETLEVRTLTRNHGGIAVVVYMDYTEHSRYHAIFGATLNATLGFARVYGRSTSPDVGPSDVLTQFVAPFDAQMVELQWRRTRVSQPNQDIAILKDGSPIAFSPVTLPNNASTTGTAPIASSGEILSRGSTLEVRYDGLVADRPDASTFWIDCVLDSDFRSGHLVPFGGNPAGNFAATKLQTYQLPDVVSGAPPDPSVSYIAPGLITEGDGGMIVDIYGQSAVGGTLIVNVSTRFETFVFEVASPAAVNDKLTYLGLVDHVIQASDLVYVTPHDDEGATQMWMWIE